MKQLWTISGIILSMGLPSERRCYLVMPPLIGWSEVYQNHMHILWDILTYVDSVCNFKSALILDFNINSLWPSDTIWWEIWVSIGWGNGLLPHGTKPLNEPKFTSSEVFCGYHLRAMSEVLMSLEITLLKLLPHLLWPIIQYTENNICMNDLVSLSLLSIPFWPEWHSQSGEA